jgi:multiple sugar transport system permease protein
MLLSLSDVTTATRPVSAEAVLGARSRRRRAGTEALLGYGLLTPLALYILVLVAYPFFLSIYFSVSNVTVAGGDGGFVGLKHYQDLLGDEVFQKALWNSLSFTFLAEIGKAVLGIGLAFLLLRHVPGKRVMRGFLMLPWTLPISLSLLSWRWMYDSQFSTINWAIAQLHLMNPPYPDWRGDALWGYVGILIVNIWRGFPFSAVIVLAGLTSIPSDIYDAAKVDGAGFFRTWHYVITPMIAPIIFLGLIFDVTFTLGDLTIVYILTNGGPGYATQIVPLLAWHTGVQGGNLSTGAAMALIFFPFLFAGVVFFLRLLNRRQAVT